MRVIKINDNLNPEDENVIEFVVILNKKTAKIFQMHQFLESRGKYHDDYN